jgi:hypothetical protein
MFLDGDLDETDAMILEALTTWDNSSYQEIANATGLSKSGVYHRRWRPAFCQALALVRGPLEDRVVHAIDSCITRIQRAVLSESDPEILSRIANRLTLMLQRQRALDAALQASAKTEFQRLPPPEEAIRILREEDPAMSNVVDVEVEDLDG